MHLVQTPPSTISTPREAAITPVSTVAPSVEGNLKIFHIMETNSEVMCCRFNSQATLLAVGLASGVTKVYSPESGHCVYSLSDQDTLNSHLPVTCLRWKPTSEVDNFGNILLASYADGRVKTWHVTTGSCIGTAIEPSRQTLACAFNSSGDQFVTAGSNTKLHVYDERTRQVVCTLQPSSSHLIMDGHTSRVFSVQYIPGQNYEFLSGGWDDTVQGHYIAKKKETETYNSFKEHIPFRKQFWDARVDNKHSVRKIFGPHICGDALDIQSSSTAGFSRHILTGSWRKDRTLQIWDYGSGKLMKDVPADYNGSMLYCVQWQGPDGILAGGSDNNMMRCVDQATNHTTGRLADLPRSVYTVDHDRRHFHHPVIAAGTGNYIYLVKKM